MSKYIFLLTTALALSLTTSGLVQAKPVATATAPNGDWVQLTDEPCTLEAAKAIMGPQYFPLAKAAEAIVSGQKFKACYIVQNGQVGLVFADGDVGMIPVDAFTNKKIM
jgi:hypothetical protein